MPWKCPKCDREFSKTNQDHYCVKPRMIDEYIAAQEESIRPRLAQLRSIIHKAIPDAEERISWSMPTFWKGTNLIHFAGFKKHIGIYPGEEAAAAFSERITRAVLAPSLTTTRSLLTVGAGVVSAGVVSAAGVVVWSPIVGVVVSAPG